MAEQTLIQKLNTAKRSFRKRLKFAILGGGLLVVIVLPLALFTHTVSFQIAPPLAANNATVSASAGIGLVLADRVFMFGKQTTLHVAALGFISQAVDVAFKKDAKRLLIEMQEAPVHVVITTQPPLPQTRWYVDGVYDSTAERFAQEFQSGIINIEVNNDFYHVQELELDVQIGKDISRHLKLTPVSGNVSIHSAPEGAHVQLYAQTGDGKHEGITPWQIPSVPGGLYRIQVMLAGYENIDEEIALTNKLTDIKRNYRLKLKQTNLRIKTSPVDGVLRVNGVPTNTAPANGHAADYSLSLTAGKKHILQYEKSGYISQSQEVLPTSNKSKSNKPVEISFQLEKEMGEVVIRSTPPADIRVNGKSVGTSPQTLRLQTVAQKITLNRAGYRTAVFLLTPTAATPLLIDEALKTELQARLSAATPILIVATGIKMKFFDPSAQSKSRFTMGAPNTDKDRRANEFQRQVNLSKPFYVSLSEITEEQFVQYKPIPVAGRHLPVRNISWLDAVRFSNWMSEQDGLQPTYAFVDGQLSDFNATADGYRLLSEAEWEWLARIAGRSETVRFVWGNKTTIPKNSGNFADQSAKGSVPKYISRYNDGFVGVAPVASFAADTVGLYDMAGNVSEWVHDIYSLQPPRAGQVERNPFGEQHNDDHSNQRTIKGASFRSASVTRLRSSFREGLPQTGGSRDDVGFRIARYLYGQE